MADQVDHEQRRPADGLDVGVHENRTVMACAVIAERGTSTPVPVDRKALAEQWVSRIHQVLDEYSGWS